MLSNKNKNNKNHNKHKSGLPELDQIYKLKRREQHTDTDTIKPSVQIITIINLMIMSRFSIVCLILVSLSYNVQSDSLAVLNPKPKQCNSYIKHGDHIALDSMCMSSARNYAVTIGRKFCRGKNPIPALFRIMKDPWYASECNYIIAGKSALLATDPWNMTCKVSTFDGVVRCDKYAKNGGARLRVLDKHGKDGIMLSMEDAYIKFRSGSGSKEPNADCSDGPSDDIRMDAMIPLTCSKSPFGQKAHYGFFLSRI